jgi:hypothetical protein
VPAPLVQAVAFRSNGREVLLAPYVGHLKAVAFHRVFLGGSLPGKQAFILLLPLEIFPEKGEATIRHGLRHLLFRS